MTMKVLFVHGTGVRKRSYEQTAARIREGLDSINQCIKMEPCLWGDSLGAKLNLKGKSIPDYDGIETAPAVEETTALWSLLYRDPLFELRELSASPSPAGPIPPAEQQRRQAFPATVRAIAQDIDILKRLGGRALPMHWYAAVEAVAAAPVLTEALGSVGRVSGSMRLATARAVVATLSALLAAENFPALDHRLRDELVDRSVSLLGGVDKSLVDWIKGRLTGLAINFGSSLALRKRDAIFDAAYPAAGDVLLYQSRGQAIRDFIGERIDTCGEDVVVIAHSLGGIACVDLLISRDLPQVKLLVTVGSQAPFLYEIGALASLSFGSPLPEHFPAKWVNFYDPNDLLSYLGAPVFTGRVLDYKICSKQPFPHSHSAYWNEQAFWDSLAPHLA